MFGTSASIKCIKVEHVALNPQKRLRMILKILDWTGSRTKVIHSYCLGVSIKFLARIQEIPPNSFCSSLKKNYRFVNSIENEYNPYSILWVWSFSTILRKYLSTNVLTFIKGLEVRMLEPLPQGCCSPKHPWPLKDSSRANMGKETHAKRSSNQ